MKFELEETVWNKFSFWNTKSDGEKIGILTPKTGFFREVFLDAWWTLVVQAFNIVETLEKRPSGFYRRVVTKIPRWMLGRLFKMTRWNKSNQ